jgi:hypothetical protein
MSTMLRIKTLVLIFVIAAGCQTKKSSTWVLTGLVVDENIHFDVESIVHIGGKFVVVRKIEIYDGSDLQQVWIAKPEGFLYYAIEDIRKDKSLIEHYNISEEIPKIKDGVLLSNGSEFSMTVEKPDSTLFTNGSKAIVVVNVLE